MAAILIVDDDPTIRAIAAEFLHDGDHAVVEANDGEEAIRIVRAVPLDLMIVDMLMPRKDGLETIMETRQINPHLPILAITSGGPMSTDYLLNLAKTLGADAVLSKPLTFARFREAVGRLILANPSAEGEQRSRA